MRIPFLSQPTPLVYAQPTLRTRAARAAGRGTWKVTHRGVRGAIRHRRRLAPVYAAVALFGAGVILHQQEHGAANNAAVLIALASAALWWSQYRSGRRGRLVYRTSRFTSPAAAWAWRRRKLIWSWGLLGTGAGWLAAACAVAPWQPPMPGLLVLWLLVAALPWWWHHRIRRVPQELTSFDEVLAEWAEHASAPGKVAPGHELSDLRDLPDPHPRDDGPATIGWAGTITAPKGKTASTVVRLTEEIAGIWDLGAADVAIERTGTSARTASLTVYTDNPLRQVRDWPGPQMFDESTGIAKVAFYGDGNLAEWRYWRESGPVHELIAGTTDSGKSRFVDQLLAIERASPHMASVVLDPQMGQSLPEWRNQVAIYARGIEECLVALRLVRDELYRRNQELSDVEWTDAQGRLHQGVDAFNVHAEPVKRLGLKLIVLTVEEAARLTCIPGALGMLEEIGTMARKCGIKERLIVQLPQLEQAGSQTLRDMVASQVAVFRTANRLSGTLAFNGNLAADPEALPREWPDGSTTSGLCYLLGPRARTAPARTWFPGDVYHWAHLGQTTELPMLKGKFEACLAYMAGETDADAVDTGLETIVAAAGMPDAHARPSGTLGQRITAWLATHDSGMATTGVIAQALDAPLSSVSTACARMATRGELVDAGHGLWARVGVEPGERARLDMVAA